jgi:hypothetical protein
MTRKILKKNGMVMYRSSVRSLTLDELGHLQGDTSLSLMIVLSWILPGQTSTNLRLGFCAGVFNWDELTSSLRYQYCPLTCARREKATWKLSFTCLHTWGYITMQELFLIPLTPLLIWVSSSRLTGRPCMVMLMSFICASVVNHDITKVMGQ